MITDDYIKRFADRASHEAAPEVHVANQVMNRINVELVPAGVLLFWPAAISAAAALFVAVTCGSLFSAARDPLALFLIEVTEGLI